MNLFLGCDVAKQKLDVALIDETGQELWIDKVTNEEGAIATLLLTICGNYLDVDLTAVVESTACYHHPLLEAALAVDIPVRVYNPILTKQAIRSSVRGKKTDRTDALVIARLGLRGEGRVHIPEPYLITKYAARAGQQLSTMAGSLKLYQKHIESVLEEELSTTSKDLLSGIQEQFKLARQQFIADTTASAPVGLMKRLQTIPGIGPYVAASLIGEIQDMTKFKTTKSLIAYSGLDPKVRQSGHSLNNMGRLSKRGSSYLRRSIFIAASVARQYDPNLKALYDKKRAEGKRYTVATVVVARKLLTIVRAVWLNDKDYDPDYIKSLDSNI